MHSIASSHDWLCTLAQGLLKLSYLQTYCNVSNGSNKMNAFKGSRNVFKSLGSNKYPGPAPKAECGNSGCEAKLTALQSSAITSRSSGCSVRALFALTFSFSSNFLLRLLSSSLMSALLEGSSSSEVTTNTSSCSCAVDVEG